MKSNIKIILISTIAAAIGLLAGYFIFGNKQNQMVADSHHHETASRPSSTDATDADAEIWACSMHPQIRQNEPGDCPLCGMDLIPLVENASDNPLVLEMTNEAVKLANIQTTIIGESDSNLSVNTIPLSGKIQPDERLASSQVAHVPGRIEKLFVSFEGEQVTEGQKIATLFSPELIAAQRELLEAVKLKDLSPGLLEAARNKLRYWKIGEATIQQIETSGQVQEVFTVYADASGIVNTRRVSVGDYVQQGAPIFDLINLQKVWVLFDAYEEDLSKFSVGDKISFTTPAMPDKTFKTTVTFIDPIINPNTRVASIRTEVNNYNGKLKPEMLVYGTLKQKPVSSAPLTVPKSAVLWTGKRSVVYIKVPDMTVPSFEFREIEIGTAAGNSYPVISGLEKGDEVVTNGSFTIDAAAQLNNQASMMNKNVAVKKAETVEQLPDFTASTPADFKSQLTQLVEAYMALKNALVATDSEAAKTSAQSVLTAVGKVDMSLLKGDAHVFWMEKQATIKAHTEKLIESDDIKTQRNQFDFLSQRLIQAVQVYGTNEPTLYVQHCPMVYGDEGADWLSDMEAIRNPYFGDKMLKCGVVKTTITELVSNK